VSGALSTDDVSAITEVVKHHFLGPERIPVFTQFGYTINKFLAKLHGDPGERLVIEMVVRSDGTVGSAAVLCPGRCSYGAEYDLRREADGWGGQPTGSGHCR
jgi:hypothetical protein